MTYFRNKGIKKIIYTLNHFHPKSFSPLSFYFPVDLLGFSSGVLPGVSLLSRRRLSGFPVDLAIALGPGLRAMIVIL